MAAPRKTAGMLNFERQLDAAFPERKRPDGWIADEHHDGTSSHHPDDTRGSKPEWNGDPDGIPDVRGLDVAAQLGPGVRMRELCDHLAHLPNLGTVVRYFIHDGQIWHVRNDFEPVDHDGDPHEEHLHVTFAFTEAADDNTTYDYHLEEFMAAPTAEDIVKALLREDLGRSGPTVAVALQAGYQNSVKALAKIEHLQAELAELKARR